MRVELELDSDQARDLSTAFAAPAWLEDMGRTAWLIVGFLLLVVGFAVLIGATFTIVGPVLVATIVATVANPAVSGLARRGVPRAAGAVIVLLGLAAIAGLIIYIVIAGITGQDGSISENASAGVAHIQQWLKDAGIDQPGADGATASLKADAPKIIATLVLGIVHGIQGLTSVVFELSLALLSTFFLLKDGPSMRRWLDRHLGLPVSVSETITGNIIRSLRGYFRGVSIVAAFNGIVVGLGAWILGVPLAGTIGVVTFVTAYVPFVGAFVAGAFAVLIALGASGTHTALIMLLIVLLANGLLQNILQPFAMGSALGLNPLVVLVTTIGAGCLFGMIGLVLAAPLTAAGVHIMSDLKSARLRSALPDTRPLEHPA